VSEKGQVSIADRARGIDEMTASFSASFYRVGGPSVRGLPALAPKSIKGDRQTDSCLFCWLLSRTWLSVHAAPVVKNHSDFNAEWRCDAAREIGEVTAVFLACFYQVVWLSALLSPWLNQTIDVGHKVQLDLWTVIVLT